jgi:predicted DNA-binding transcriptional regulator AlpA
MTTKTDQGSAVPWPDEKPVLGVPDLARALGINRYAFYRVRDAGQLPFPLLKLGSRDYALTADVRKALGLPTERPAPSVPTPTRTRSRARSREDQAS